MSGRWRFFQVKSRIAGTHMTRLLIWGPNSVPMGAMVGAVVGAFIIGGVLASLLFFWVSRRRGGPSLDLRDGPSGDRELRPTPYITSEMGSRVPYSPLAMRDESYSTNNSGRPLMRSNSRSSGAVESPNLAGTGLRAEAFDPSVVSSSRTQPSASPPSSPIDAPRSERDTRSQVYVVHHDGGRAPVTIMTSDGAEVVELPPGYSSVPEASRPRALPEPGRPKGYAR